MIGWLKFLDRDVYIRLSHCISTKADLESLVNAKWRYYKENGLEGTYTKEDALINVLELLESNGRCMDLTLEEYRALKK